MFAIRGPFAALGGALVAVTLFFALSQLVKVPFVARPPGEGLRIEFTRQIVDTAPDRKRPPKVEPEPPTREPNLPRIGIPKEGGRGVELVTFTKPTLGTRTGGRGIGLNGVDNDVIPRVRVNPEYPQQAITRNIEGWVQVRFTVTAIGTVRDAEVVASEPGTTFDEAALKAIARWRYNPRIENGEAVERVGLQTVIRFELEN